MLRLNPHAKPRARSGAAQAAALCAVLWTLTTNLGGYFDARPLPSNYTASNITVAVKTAVEVGHA